MSETEQESAQPVRSPMAGCLIFIIIAIVAIFVVTFAAYSFKKQTEGFASFTENSESKTPIAEPTILNNRLSRFSESLTTKEEQTFRLTANEINGAIAHYPELESLRGQLFVQSLAEGKIQAQLHLPLASTKDMPEILRNGLGIEPRDNFLISEMTATPLLTDGRLFLMIDTLTPSRGEVPEAVIQALSPFQIFPDLKEDSPVKKVLAQLTSIHIEDNSLIFERRPNAEPPSGKAEADKLAEKARHLVALGAVIFLLTMILFFLLMAKRKRQK